MANGRKTGGRRAGTPNKATRKIRNAARRLLEDPAYLRSVRARLLEGKAPQLEVLLHHYAYGKPKESVEQTGPPQHIVVRVEKPW
jgi:hypothetical protein